MQDRTKRRIAIAAAVVLALVGLYALAGFVLVPYMAQRELARYASGIDRTAQIGELRFNPFTWTVEARNVALKEKDGSPIGSIERLYADFDFVSIVRHVHSFASLEIEGADLNVVSQKDGTLNLVHLAPPRAASTEPAAPSTPPAIAVHDLKIERTTVRYTDRATSHATTSVLGPVSLHVADLSTVAGNDGRYTLSAGLPGGATFSGEGTLALEPLASTGSVKLEKLDFAAVWPFLRDHVRMAQPRGSAALQASYKLEHKGKAASFTVTDADLRLTGVHLATGEGKPLLDLQSAHAARVRYDSASNAIVVPTLDLQKGRYVAALDAAGQFNWAQLAAPSKQDDKPGSPWSAHIDAAKLSDIAVRYDDATRRTPLAVDVAKGGATLKLALVSDGKSVRTTVDRIALDLADIALAQRGASAPLVKLASGRLEGGRIDTQERVIAAGNVVLAGGSAAIAREADGTLPLLEAFASSKPAAPSAGAPWRFALGAASLQKTRLAVSDASLGAPLKLDLDVASLAVRGMDATARSPLRFETSINIAQGGTLSGSGTAAQDFSRASAKVRVAGLSLAPVQGIVSRYVTLTIRSGSASADTQIEYARSGKPMLRVAGGARVSDLALNDSRTRQPFLKWKALAADNLAFTLAPNRLDVKELTLDQAETAIIISKERKVNLTQVLKAAPAEAHAKPAAAPQPQRAQDDATAFPVRVGRVRLQNATLDFADYSLVLPFSTRVTRLNGTVVGVSTDPQSRAELKLGGRIETSGYASAEGGLNLRQPTEFMDINVKFQNVQMPPLSPYTATFAGRKIDGGRLWLDLDYKIVHQQLAGANKILLENVVLGERVKAPNALDLPLDLAIALLKDSQGRINMAVPVTGNVGNPSFDYGSLIRDAISTAIGRIVSAPFRALASLFGGENSADVSKVRFGAGSTRLYPPERESLQKVAKALSDRPQLKVVVHGTYDPKRDAESLRLQPVRRDLAQAMGMTGKSTLELGPIAYSDAETQRAIEKLFVARAGRDALREFSAQYAKQHGENATKDGDARRAYYEAMFDRLVALQPLSATALQELAAGRAKAIADALGEAGIDASRIQIGDVREVTDGSEPTVNTELALAVNDKRS